MRWLAVIGVAVIFLHPLAIAADAPAVQPPHISVAVRRDVCDVPGWEVSRSGLPRGYYLAAWETERAFPRDMWVTMTAVAIAESAGNPADIGDRDTPYPSVGLFQVRLIHRAMLERLTGSTREADWIRWLQDPDNNAEAAVSILRYGGLGQWGAYTSGRWRLFLAVSKQALGAIGR